MRRIILISALVLFVFRSYAVDCVLGSLVVDTVVADCCLEPGDQIVITINQAPLTICTVAYWKWYFGDGTIIVKPGNELSINYSFSTPGNFSIHVIPFDVSDNPLNDPQSSVLTTNVQYFTSSQCMECAILSFSYHNLNCANSSTVFQPLISINSCLVDSFTVFWSFGDGISIDASFPLNSVTHVYGDSGWYYVTATLTCYIGTDSCIVTSSQSVNSGMGLTQFIQPSNLIVNTIPTLGGVPVQFIGSSPHSTGTLYFGDGTAPFNWDFDDTIYHTYPIVDTPVTYTIILEPYTECDPTITVNITVYPPFTPLPCEDCIGSFNPEQGKRYLVSAWVKEEGAAPTVTSYSSPALFLSFSDNSSPIVSLPNMYPKGILIDGWQRIEEEFTVPVNAAFIDINLVCSTGNCLFDDIRVFPYDGTMKSYVYDPVSLRLMAELDERNYATMYEYDEEGKLVRVKKETERGIMTIKENRNNTSKHQFGQ